MINAIGATDSVLGLSEGVVPQRAEVPVSLQSNRAEMVHLEFEAVVLKSFIEDMLPEGSENVFGKGVAGEMWRSMLAEQIARELSKSSVMGISGKITNAAPTRFAPETGTVPGR